jgi:arylsulfatase
MAEETKSQTETPSKQSDDRAPNRRSILLAGTSLAAVTAIGAVDRIQVAQAQQPAAPSGQRPNILVIWGDDVGLANVSAYSFGLMGYKTPNIALPAKD